MSGPGEGQIAVAIDEFHAAGRMGRSYEAAVACAVRAAFAAVDTGPDSETILSGLRVHLPEMIGEPEGEFDAGYSEAVANVWHWLDQQGVLS